jgi:ATP-dependent DNA helicase MPH1
MSDFEGDEFGDIDDAALAQAAAEAEAAFDRRSNFAGPARPAKRRRVEDPAAARPGPAVLRPSEDRIWEELSDPEAFEDTAPTTRSLRQFDSDEFEKELENLSSSAFQALSPFQSNVLGVSRSANGIPVNGLRQTTLFGRDGVPDPVQNTRRNRPPANQEEPETHHQLDLDAAKTWIYPTNLGKIRDYQFNIVAKSLFHNTLVALPTGLGKTFIAATVMLNWYRWTKGSQIVFVAPTKPLVAQQIHACFHIAGIPYSDTSVLTGEVAPAQREDEWASKRVFFMTPQTLQSDLSKGYADPKKIILLVVDEAHRATGNYAYVEVVRFIRRFNESFRILALTATPGGDVEAVQAVIDGLDIAKVEIRTDHSIDIREYVYDRQVEREVFQNSGEMKQIMDLYCKAVRPVMSDIASVVQFWSSDPLTLTPFGCNQMMRKFSVTDGARANPKVKGKVMSVLSLLGGIAHGMDLLKFHGLTAAAQSWLNFAKEKSGGKSFYREKLLGSEPFKRMMELLEEWMRDPEFVRHPKLAHLRHVILNHLLDVEETNKRTGAAVDTRIMVFSTFRDSAEEISKVLARCSSLVKPHVFVGQADGKNSRGMTQKRQLEVIEKFKRGEFNTLIATSIGEEGLDIGQVDLIVCYDSKASPLRMLQRMGRTGRKRAGRVVLLQMEGKEENDWRKAIDSYQSMQSEIAAGDKFIFHASRSRRILPRAVQPTVNKCLVDMPVENTQVAPDELPAPRRRQKTSKKKFHMPDNVETGFVTASFLAGRPTAGAGKMASTGKTASTLAGSKKTATKKSKAKQKAANAIDEAEPIPSLDAVVLSSAETRDLQRRFQYTHYGRDEDAVISSPALGRHPERQRALGATSLVPHGRAARAFAATMGRMAATDEHSAGEFAAALDERDVDEMLAEDDGGRRSATRGHTSRRAAGPRKSRKGGARKSTPERFGSLEASVGLASSSAAEDAAFAMPFTQGVDLGSQDTPAGTQMAGGDDEDTDLDGFVVGDDDEVEVESSSGEELPTLSVQLGSSFVGAAAPDENSSSDAELTDLDEMLRRKRERKRKARGTSGRTSRVVPDSDL